MWIFILKGKSMKTHFKVIHQIKNFLTITALLAVASQSFAGQVSITGKVTKVGNNNITIKTSDANAIPKGSRVDLFFEISEGQNLEIGQWKVSGRGKGVVYATPVDMIGPPQEGMTAKISYSGEKTRVQVSRQDHHNAPPISQTENTQEKKAPVNNSQQYVDAAKKIEADLTKNSKKYSKEKNQTLQKQLVQNVKKAVAGDNAEAYYLLAFLHQNGIAGISRSSKKMVENLIISAKKGYAKAQFMLGDMYKSGDEVIKDKGKAIYWLQKAADQGHQVAEMELDLMEPQIRGKEPKEQSAGILLPDKSPEAYEKEGEKYYFEEKNYDKAFKAYEQGALMGQAGCQNMLGYLYHSGHGVKLNNKKAVEWYKKSALQEHPIGLFNLGAMYASGLGIKQDYREAWKLFLKSANLGVAEAQFQLGVLYSKGLGTNKDNTTARKWFKKAADLGNQKAIKKLAE